MRLFARETVWAPFKMLPPAHRAQVVREVALTPCLADPCPASVAVAADQIAAAAKAAAAKMIIVTPNSIKNERALRDFLRQSEAAKGKSERTPMNQGPLGEGVWRQQQHRQQQEQGDGEAAPENLTPVPDAEAEVAFKGGGSSSLSPTIQGGGLSIWSEMHIRTRPERLPRAWAFQG